MIHRSHPLQSLTAGHWFKLICGASYQHLPAVRSLTLAYALAGADCIDVAADPSVIAMAQEALQVAERLRPEAIARGYAPCDRPWLMVSLNDGEDPHFRKADFDPQLCPPDCPRPCEAVCPADAIVWELGVIRDRCYGCGRCLPICPSQQILATGYVSTPTAVAPLVLQTGVDALEIHTQVGRLDGFARLWQAIAPWTPTLKLIAVSCPDGDGLIDYLHALYDLMSPLPCANLWQTDGRPMSGDIGRGTTHATIQLGQTVRLANLPGYVQLAGGTNHHTVPKLRQLELLPRLSGVAYGSYARTLLNPVLEPLEAANARLESLPDALWQAVDVAFSLVGQLKRPVLSSGVPAMPPSCD